MSLKHDSTFQLIDNWIKSIEDNSPINVSFLTQPISSSITCRVKTLETLYNKSAIYRFLLKKGVYPLILFSTVSGGIGYGLHKSYSRSTKLVLNLLGVLYPTYTCWQLIKEKSNAGNVEQLKSWLTYWMIFGLFQVLDHWMESDLFLFATTTRKKYNLYKLFILYWAQNPHSNGSQLLYRHVIQKPEGLEKKEEEAEVKEIKKVDISSSNIVLYQEQQAEEEEEQHTISIIGYSYLDGYNPPQLLSHLNNDNHTSSSSSDEDDSVKSQQNNNNTSIPSTQEKETFPPLSLMDHSTSTESAW